MSGLLTVQIVAAVLTYRPLVLCGRQVTSTAEKAGMEICYNGLVLEISGHDKGRFMSKDRMSFQRNSSVWPD